VRAQQQVRKGLQHSSETQFQSLDVCFLLPHIMSTAWSLNLILLIKMIW
jgi:hypothetical protein